MTAGHPDSSTARWIEACLLGGAIGDSLGAEIEFSPLHRILETFPEGFDRLPPYDGIEGAITDDTQMTLFTAEGLIRAAAARCDAVGPVHDALLRWFRTQGGTPRLPVDTAGLFEDQRLHSRRAPGRTCLSALRAARRRGEPADNPSKGCGTIMRVAPVAFLPPLRITPLAMATSALTHGHRTAQTAAAAWAEILHDLWQGADIETAARRQLNRFGVETNTALRNALAAPRNGLPETVNDLGRGWVAEEALAIALYACLAARDFEHGLTIAVTHSGDSDSTGAIAGNALALIFPDQVFGHRWAAQVECRDLIAGIAGQLAEMADTGALQHI